MSNPLDVLYESLNKFHKLNGNYSINLVRRHADLIADVIRAADEYVPMTTGLSKQRMIRALDALKAALSTDSVE